MSYRHADFPPAIARGNVLRTGCGKKRKHLLLSMLPPLARGRLSLVLAALGRSAGRCPGGRVRLGLGGLVILLGLGQPFSDIGDARLVGGVVSVKILYHSTAQPC